MKELVIYAGCTTPVRLPSYEKATKLVLEKLGVNLIDMKNANCCGTQFVESLSKKAFIAMSGRILALGEHYDRDILAICGACSGSLKMVKHELDNDEELCNELNELLAEEDLKYTGSSRVKHLLQVLNEDIGYEAIERAVVNPYSSLRLAAHYGCHVTRPFEIVQVDDPENPTIIDRIIEIIGADQVNYTGKTRCCGGPLLAMDEEVATKIGLDKIRNIQNSGADGLITACQFCNIQLSQCQFGEGMSPEERIPVLTLPQLMGPALGIPMDELGVWLNRIDSKPIFGALQEAR